ncbi:MAG: Ig-like domain-containing protein, partial [Stenotrophomonas sp.]
HDNAGVWTGNLANGQATDDRTPTFSGKAEASSTIMVFNHGEEVGFASVDENGNWKYTAEPLADGEHRFTFVSFDVAGNLSDASETWTVVIAAAARSMGSDGGTEVLLSVNDLLVDGEASMFNADLTDVGVAEVLSIAALGLSDRDTLQDSWATTSGEMQVGSDCLVRNTIEDVNLLDQQLND